MRRPKPGRCVWWEATGRQKASQLASGWGSLGAPTPGTQVSRKPPTPRRRGTSGLIAVVEQASLICIVFSVLYGCWGRPWAGAHLDNRTQEETRKPKGCCLINAVPSGRAVRRGSIERTATREEQEKVNQASCAPCGGMARRGRDPTARDAGRHPSQLVSG